MRRKGFKYTRGQPMRCPKCGHETSQTKDLSMSSKHCLLVMIVVLMGLKVGQNNHRYGNLAVLFAVSSVGLGSDLGVVHPIISFNLKLIG